MGEKYFQALGRPTVDGNELREARRRLALKRHQVQTAETSALPRYVGGVALALQEDLNRAEQWTKDWQLSFNTGHTQMQGHIHWASQPSVLLHSKWMPLELVSVEKSLVNMFDPSNSSHTVM